MSRPLHGESHKQASECEARRIFPETENTCTGLIAANASRTRVANLRVVRRRSALQISGSCKMHETLKQTIRPGHRRTRSVRIARARAARPALRKGWSGAARGRRGVWMLIPSAWRRCEMGTNHIACYGIWRKGRRRDALRVNRTGETRWHRPYRLKAIVLPGKSIRAS